MGSSLQAYNPLGKAKTPSIPNYSQGAQEESILGHYNTNTPFGTSQWNQLPNGQWAQQNQLSPLSQQLFNEAGSLGSQNMASLGQNAINQSLAPYIGNYMGTSSQDLINQGIKPGSQAWNTAMQPYNTNMSNFEAQANLAGAPLGSELQEMPLNELNALRQASTPQADMGGAPDLSTAAQQQYSAQVGNVNARNGQQGGMSGGILSLMGSLL
jgi:hypothetical protein